MQLNYTPFTQQTTQTLQQMFSCRKCFEKVIKLERDLAGILSAATRDGRYGLRDSFAKCVEIVMIAGMEPDEWEEMMEDVGSSVLTLEERRRARSLVQR